MPKKLVAEYGDCCSALREALTSEFEPLMRVNEEETLFLSVGYFLTDEGPTWYDHAVLFCPFCGTKLQDVDDSSSTH